MIWLSRRRRAAARRCSPASLFGPFWVVRSPSRLRSCSTSYVRGQGTAACGTSSRSSCPENLDVLASALRAGHSLAGAMGVVADEAPEPSKREFSRVVTDEQLGIPLDEALEVTAKRMQNTDMDQVAVLALVQREAGGNTAEVLDQVTKNIRARMDVRRLVTVLTAQGKFSSVDRRARAGRHLPVPHARQPRPPRSALPRDARPGRARSCAIVMVIAGLLRHPTNRRDRALSHDPSSSSSSGSSSSPSPSTMRRAGASRARRAVDRDDRADRRLRLRRLAADAGEDEHGPGFRARLDDVARRDRRAGSPSTSSRLQRQGLPHAADRRRHVHDDPGAARRAAVPVGGDPAFVWFFLARMMGLPTLFILLTCVAAVADRLGAPHVDREFAGEEAPRADREGASGPD